MANATTHTGEAGILTVGDMARAGPAGEEPSDLGDGVNTPWPRTGDQPYVQDCARKLATNMNPLVENIPAKTVVAPTLLPGKPAHRILVVEDNAVIRELNVRVLALDGYQVNGAEDGAAGWQLLDGGNFDLLITDHEMPRRSGLELVKQVRSVGMTLPIIMATGSLLEEELERLPWLQLDATLLKPFSPEQLRQTVKRVLCSAECAAKGLLSSPV
jgi:CheY-like chemotaxis protein